MGMRMFLGHVYLLLIIGGLTMVYPFMLMLSASISDDVDVEDHDLIPLYLSDDDQLMRKYLAEKYAGMPTEIAPYFKLMYNLPTLTRLDGIEKEALPDFAHRFETEEFETMIEDWREFKSALDVKYTTHNFEYRFRGGAAIVGLVPGLWRKHLKERFDNDIDSYNNYYDAAQLSWSAGGGANSSAYTVNPPGHGIAETHRFWLVKTRLQNDWDKFRSEMDPRFVRVFKEDFWYRHFLIQQYGTLDKINNHVNGTYQTVSDIYCPLTMPESGVEQETWKLFMLDRCPVYFIYVHGDYNEAFRDFLSLKFSLDEFKDVYRTPINDWNDVAFPNEAPTANQQIWAVWSDFLDAEVDPADMEIRSTYYLYRNSLREKYNSIEKLNLAYGTDYIGFENVHLPYKEEDFYDFKINHKSLKKHFIFKNFSYVIGFLFTQGRAFFNTTILVLGTIIAHLTFQPLAAFALSRYRLPYSHKILLFLLATMAFPAEVAMIPNFLLLKELNLLNTFWALILPGAANGYAIFFSLCRLFLYHATRDIFLDAFRCFTNSSFDSSMTKSKPLSVSKRSLPNVFIYLPGLSPTTARSISESGVNVPS